MKSRRGFALVEVLVIVGVLVFIAFAARIARAMEWWQIAAGLFILAVLLTIVRLWRVHRDSRIDPGPTSPPGFDVIAKEGSMRDKSAVLHRRAFSLLEVLISIAMVLLLMYGVVKIFGYTSNTIGTGLAVSEVNRSQRGTLSAFSVDIGGFQRLDTSTTQTDASPGLVIRSQATTGYIDKAAFDAGTSSTFRTDTIGLFAKGSFRRQTTNRGSLSADSGMTSSQAWIHLGHLWLPDNGGAWSAATYPGAGLPATNQNNHYARQWSLGRVIISLRNLNYPVLSPTDIAAGTSIQDRWQVATVASMEPIASSTLSSTRWDGTAFNIYQSRYDLAGVHPLDPANVLAYPSVPWSTSSQPFDYFRARTNPAGGIANWWLQVAEVSAGVPMRFQANPLPTKPFDPTTAGINGGSAKMAQTFPIFLPHCSDFIVEFAGDFDPVDGVVDSYTDTDGVQKMRWYGFPRDVNGDGVWDISDVAPVSWHTTMAPTFEKTIPPKPGGFPITAAPAAALAQPYLCAWGGDSAVVDAAGLETTSGTIRRPRLLRINCTVHDANGRLADGQRYEYIQNLN